MKDGMGDYKADLTPEMAAIVEPSMFPTGTPGPRAAKSPGKRQPVECAQDEAAMTDACPRKFSAVYRLISIRKNVMKIAPFSIRHQRNPLSCPRSLCYTRMSDPRQSITWQIKFQRSKRTETQADLITGDIHISVNVPEHKDPDHSCMVRL